VNERHDDGARDVADPTGEGGPSARVHPDTPGAATPRILLASRNAKKLIELRRILAPLVDVEVIGLDDLPSFPDVPETGATFEENALIKARDAFAHTGLPTVADDSGLAVDALNGMPGVLSARWAGVAKNDEANVRLVLEQVTDVPDDRLGAAFVCAVALIVDGREQVVEGRMPGHLVRQPRGTGGFGYDPIFVADGHRRTSAELTPAEKDEVSHRGRALRQLAPLIQAELGR
jgi:XTP/dITP diphosphohydrolase